MCVTKRERGSVLEKGLEYNMREVEAAAAAAEGKGEAKGDPRREKPESIFIL